MILPFTRRSDFSVFCIKIFRMKAILLTFCLIVTLSLYAQEREIQNVLLFSRQSQIDSFRIYYPTATSLTNLQITGPDITNLDSLIGLKRINGTLNIYYNPLLQNLSGWMTYNM